MAKLKNINVRVSDTRDAKVRLYAERREITVTQAVEEMIDRLEIPPSIKDELQKEAS